MATDQVDGWLARRWNQTSAFGSLLDPIADKVLVMAALVMLISEGVAPAWMVAAIIAREFLVSGLRLAAIERGIVIAARDLGKLKTWAQALAVVFGGFAAAGAWCSDIAWWVLLVAVVLTWVSGSTTPAWRRACSAPAAPSSPRRGERKARRLASWKRASPRDGAAATQCSPRRPPNPSPRSTASSIAARRQAEPLGYPGLRPGLVTVESLLGEGSSDDARGLTVLCPDRGPASRSHAREGYWWRRLRCSNRSSEVRSKISSARSV